MHKTCIAGAGTIGTLIATSLAHSGDYEVYLLDKNVSHVSLPESHSLHFYQLDVTNETQFHEFLTSNKIEIVVSSLPYFYNIIIAKSASLLNIHYFDLTEDIHVAQKVKELSKNKERAFVSQCGVAPGFINIMANHLISQFDKVHAAYLRAGCLPKSTNNALKYAITWSIDGLINEYGNVCYGLVNGKKTAAMPLGDLETIELDGHCYEAFNTSGGVGSLIDSYQEQVNILNYKTLRYRGHCEKMHFLMNTLGLNEDRETLKRILKNSLPTTDQDVMLLYVAVTGEKSGNYVEQSYIKKIEPKEIYGRNWSAIQISTAFSLCTIVDLVISDVARYKGFILQEEFPLDSFLQNRFGNIYT